MQSRDNFDTSDIYVSKPSILIDKWRISLHKRLFQAVNYIVIADLLT